MSHLLARVLASLVFFSFLPLAAAIEVRAIDLRDAQGEEMCLDIDDWKLDKGTSLLLWTCHGGANQRFRYDAASGEIRSVMGDYCVDVDQGKVAKGQKVQLWTCNGSDAQKFTLSAGEIRFRKNPDYCLDGGDRIENAGSRLKLWTCNGTAAQRLARHSPYGERRFDELTWLTTHNAFANYEDSRWTLPNQSRGIARQLRDGVRGFMLDVHTFDPETWRCVLSFGADCGGKDVYLCHGNCGGVAGFGFALPRQTLAGTLGTIVKYLEENPDEIVTVFLEDYTQKDDLRKVLDGVPGLRRLQFDPDAWKVRQKGWPRAADMVDANRRLLIFSDKWDKAELGARCGAELTVENYWSIGNNGSHYACTARWGDVPLDRQDSQFNRLFVLNHFRDVPTVIGSAIDNSYANLLRRVNDFCVGKARRKPNYVAVDFYELGDWGPMEFVHDVNRATAILFQHGDHTGKAQLLGPGWHRLAAITVGNDALSAIALLPGTRATLFEHDDFAGEEKKLAGSTDSLGSFNDRTSSLLVEEDVRLPY